MNAGPSILILSGVQGDTRRYRAFHLYEQLRLAGCKPILAHLTSPDLVELAQTADILILQRVTWDRQAARLVNSVRARGGLVISDVDDLVFDPGAFRWIDAPDFSDPTRARLYQENMRRNRETIDQSQAVLVSTPYLAEQVERLGKPAWIHRNGFSLEMYARSLEAQNQTRPEDGKVTLGYASGTPTHQRDFRLLKTALLKILRDYPQVELHIAGHLDPGKGWDPVMDKIRRLPFVPWRQLPGVLRQFSINLAPLRVDNPFSQSKSEIKYMEAALVEVVTIASPTAAFQQAIQDGETGYLAGSPEEWEAVLRMLIENPDLRRRVGQQACQDVVNKYAPWVRAGQIVQLLNQILEQEGSPVERLPVKPVGELTDPQAGRPYWIGESVEHYPTLIERGLYSLRMRGVRTLLKEVWIFLRRLAAPIFPFNPPGGG